MTYKHFPMDIDGTTSHMSTSVFLHHVRGSVEHIPKLYDSSYINFVASLPDYQRASFLKFFRNYLKRSDIHCDRPTDFSTIDTTPLIRSCFELAARYYFL